MEIKNTVNTAPLIALTGIKTLPGGLPQLQPGNTLNAVVTAKLAENSFILTLAGGQTIRAQTPTALEIGQPLKLEVAKVGAIPELKIIAPLETTQPEKAAVVQALREFLPKQQNLTDFTVSLRQLAATALDKPEAVNKAINEVLMALPSKDDLVSEEGLKQGVSNSGVFLEAKLANQLSPHGDLKAQLLVLADTLQNTQADQQGKGNIPPANPNPNMVTASLDLKHAVDKVPPERLAEVIIQATDKENALLNKTEGAIARIVVDQLASLPKNDVQQNSWQIQIPYTHGQHTDTVQLNISREPKPSKGNEKPNWSVVLELNPPGLGKLQSRISLIDDRIDTYFWSDQQAIAALVHANLSQLADSYTEAGLAVGNLNALEGAVNTKPSDFSAQPGLLDERI
jgi:flagellar hook-length control protein FliK